jgi:hypothetical protein
LLLAGTVGVHEPQVLPHPSLRTGLSNGPTSIRFPWYSLTARSPSTRRIGSMIWPPPRRGCVCPATSIPLSALWWRMRPNAARYSRHRARDTASATASQIESGWPLPGSRCFLSGLHRKHPNASCVVVHVVPP